MFTYRKFENNIVRFISDQTLFCKLYFDIYFFLFFLQVELQKFEVFFHLQIYFVDTRNKLVIYIMIPLDIWIFQKLYREAILNLFIEETNQTSFLEAKIEAIKNKTKKKAPEKYTALPHFTPCSIYLNTCL